jgi:hypothetical protein
MPYDIYSSSATHTTGNFDSSTLDPVKQTLIQHSDLVNKKGLVYEVFKLPIPEFTQQVKKFFNRFTGFSANKRTRKEAMQAAVNIWIVYKFNAFKDAQQKWNIMEQQHKQSFKESLPQPTKTFPNKLADDLKAADAKYNMLLEQVELLVFWLRQLTAKKLNLDSLNKWHQSDIEQQQKALSYVSFLNCPTGQVKLTLEKMVEESTKKCRQPQKNVNWENTWTAGIGVKTERSWDITRVQTAIRGGASFFGGFSGEGKLTVAWKCVNVEAGHKEKAGIWGAAQGSVTADYDLRNLAEGKHVGITAEGSAEIGMGFTAEQYINLNVADILLFDAKAEELAVAMAKATGKFTLGTQGFEITAKAEALAGVQLKGTANLTVSLDKRTLLSTQATGELTAGAGAHAGFTLASPSFGDTKLEFDLGASLGFGTGGSVNVNFSFHNAAWLAQNAIIEHVLPAFIYPEAKYYSYVKDPKENQELAIKAKGALIELMMEVQTEKDRIEDEIQSWYRRKETSV